MNPLTAVLTLIAGVLLWVLLGAMYSELAGIVDQLAGRLGG